MLNADLGVGCGSSTNDCNSGGCPGVPDLCIKRHDTRPSFKISISDCDGVVDLTDENLVLEASMWFDAKLKTAIDDSDTTFKFADNIGFDQVIAGDVIVTGKSRSPEKMLVTAVDESEKSITVTRSHDGTTAQSWPRGTVLNVFRFVDESAEIQSYYEDVTSVDGAVANELTDTMLVYNWTTPQTSMPGCYWLEFKLVMISPETSDVEWTKRFPLASEGFIINVVDTPTSPM
jgi:hypothetical protein